jgi:molecular chaperone GrpE
MSLSQVSMMNEEDVTDEELNGDPSAEVQDDPAATVGAADERRSDEAATLRRERDDLYDRLLRKSAEFDNYRKRVDKERRELAEWAAADVLTDLIMVLDDFDRALAVEAPPEAEPYRAGVELIRRQLAELLRKRGVTMLDTVGTDFDPHLHQAVAYEESPGAREGEIIGELRKGYRLGDRLLRPAMVRVAKAS